MTLDRFEIGGVAEFAKEIAAKGLEGKPKVSLQFELSPSGITSLLKAEASIEETYLVEEEVEVDDDEEDAANATGADSEDVADKDEKKTEDVADTDERKTEDVADTDEKKTDETDKANETEDASAEEDPKNETKNETVVQVEDLPKKKKKKITVEKEKKRLHKRTLKVSPYYESKVQPHWDELMAQSKAKLAEMDESDKKRIMLEESKNSVESYMYKVKNKLIDDEEELSTVSTEEQREECRKLSSDTELWLEDDGYSADYATMEDKYAELTAPFEKILLRLREKTARATMVAKLEEALKKTEELLVKWETTKPQVNEEEREKVTEKIATARAFIKEKEEAQAAKESHEDPAYLSADLVEKVTPVEALMQRLSKKPKPKPPKKELNETKSENATETNATDTSSTETNATETNATDTNSTEEEAAEKEAEGGTERSEGKPTDEESAEESDEGDDEL